MVRGAPRISSTLGLALFGGAAALVPALLMRGFTVDDALISVRYARNLALGLGYRFNATGPATDGVTPLPWAFLLAPLARADALTVLGRAKLLGIASWTLSAALLGGWLARRATRSAVVVVALLTIALAFPIAAWSASGMETGLVTALASCAAISAERPLLAALLAGACAAFRPELAPWAMALAAGFSPKGLRPVTLSLALASGPFLACVVVRLLAFGRAAPLAVLAKPSDLSHGVPYALAAAVVCLTPLLALSPITLWRVRLPVARAIAIAALVHVFAVMLAGGDWMPFARLFVPVAPSLAVAFVLSSEHAPPWSNVARGAIALGLGVFLVVQVAPSGRDVQRDRERLVAEARPALANANVVAALDVGWVSAATDARIVDLAGLTDPEIAVLPGGHTSKRVDVTMLLDRKVDVVVVQSDLRVVEARILRAELFRERYEEAGAVPLGSRGASYTFYRRR